MDEQGNISGTIPPGMADSQKTAMEALEKAQVALSHFETFSRFGIFANSALPPKISDSEVLVCFADVRGFTHYCKTLQQEMQDRKIQNFLREHGKIYVEGLLRWNTLAEAITRPELFRVIREPMVPATYKNLGDGLMMVWEIPKNLQFPEESMLINSILNAVQEMERVFYEKFRDLTPAAEEAFTKEVEKLEIGFGIAKGHAWRLEYPGVVDYAGSLVNLAARLQDRARPRGRVIHTDVASWKLEHLTSTGDGRIAEIAGIRGYTDVRVWVSNEVVLS